MDLYLIFTNYVYYHFENKEKLFDYLAQDDMRSWGEKWAAISPNNPNVTEKLYAMADFVHNNYKTPLLKVGQELAANPAASPETVQQLYGLAVTPMQAYAAIFQQGMETGEFAIEDLQGTTFLFGTLLGRCFSTYLRWTMIRCITCSNKV